MQSLNNLLPCPFCGSPAGEVIHHFQPQRRADGTLYEARSVHCSRMFKDCMGHGPIKDSEEEAIAAWNTRKHAKPE